MSQTLWDTTGSDVLQALLNERRAAGALASGLALTLIVVADEKRVSEAEAAATTAAAAHPCRLLIVVPRKIDADIRLDAEVQIGGRLGPTEAVVLRMWGRLSLHAESVVLPLLAPDAPVVTWWHGPPPEDLSTEPLGVLASRRITDTSQAADPLAALHLRAMDHVAGDTDLAWTRTTPWRALLASSTDSSAMTPRSATVTAEASNTTAALLSGWLKSRLNVETNTVQDRGPGVTSASLQGSVDGEAYNVDIRRPDGRLAHLDRTGEGERQLPLPRRNLGELLAEELRRMEPDVVYAEALAAATGVSIDPSRPPRTFRWHDPAWRNESTDAAV